MTLRTQATLKQQVEEILDTSPHQDEIDIIVQMVPERGQHERLSAAASGAISRRRFVQSPRELLPQPSKTDTASPTTQVSIFDLLSAGALAAALVTVELLEEWRTGRTSGLRSLLRDEIARGGAATMGPSGTTEEPKPLIAANAMPLRVRRTQLNKLLSSESVERIQAVHINRKFQLPTITPAKPLAEETEDTLASTWGVRKTNALAAWGRYGAKGSGVKVGILDTGVDADHPDLKGKVLEFAEFNSLGQLISDKPRDSHEHGTHCAGTIVGGDYSKRAIGMAPEAQLAAALVLDGENGATDAQILAGIDWALTQGVDVISMSLGGLTMDAETPPTYTEAILSCLEQGVPVVVAIGNSGHQTTGSPGNDLFALSVGATDNSDRAAGFSGGRTQVITHSEYIEPRFLPLAYTKPELSAPGVAVTSSVPNSGWKTISGTSMATPHVAGAIAQLLSATSIRDKAKGLERAFLIQDLIIGSAEDCGESGQDQRFGFGRVDVLRALDYAADRGSERRHRRERRHTSCILSCCGLAPIEPGRTKGVYTRYRSSKT